MNALVQRSGRPELLFVAPHAPVDLAAALPYFPDEPAVRTELADRVADWHDLGSDVALDAAADRVGCTAVRPTVPRAVVDLNRGWRGRVEEKETLFGKGAMDAWVKAHLVPGAEVELERYFRAAHAGIRAAAADARGLVELHSYGDLGSTYDRQAGGRPIRRPDAAVVHGAPWTTAYPVGVARLIPANLRATPYPVEARVGVELAKAGLIVGPSPYPSLLPWTVSARFLAERWFRWLGRIDLLPAATARRLGDVAWTDEQSVEIDLAATEGSADWPGVLELARLLGRWSHEGAHLADRFGDEDGTFTVGVEIRIDRIDRAGAFGQAVAVAADVDPPAPRTWV